MRPDQQPRSIDLLLRGSGLVLLAVGGLAVLALVRTGPLSPAVMLFCLCAIAFLGLTLGAALLTLGAHLLDEVALSGRWAPPYGDDGASDGGDWRATQSGANPSRPPITRSNGNLARYDPTERDTASKTAS